MLYTRCPECETTFRITEGALQQAQGQVRCGRCSHIFNAHEELSEVPGDSGDSGDTAAEVSGHLQPLSGSAAPARNAGGGKPSTTTFDAGSDASPEVSPDPGAGVGGGWQGEKATAVADVTLAVADVTLKDTMSAGEVEAVLEQDAPPPPLWVTDDELAEASPRSRLWLVAACVGVLAIFVQLTNHYRADLATHEIIGPAVRSVYAGIGLPVTPNWDVDQYALLNMVAIADPALTGQGNLIIHSQLKNAGNSPQPYPYVYLRLLDRWEEAVGSRMFTPEQYLVAPRSGSMMNPGQTVEAELVVVDPGSDASGFELAVCIDVENGIDCDTDATFR
jgi:predicted Zn finger-like uncharacterized protein